MQIKHLEVINFKNIKEFNHEFVQGIYLVTGENDIGKSHLIQAIVTLLSGERNANMLTKDEKTGHIRGTFVEGDIEYEVLLRYDEKNPRGVLKIGRKGDTFSSSQVSALQQLFNYTDFDAGEFILWGKTAEGRKKQVNLVRSLMPADVVAEIDLLNKEIATKFDERTDLNREVKRLDAVLQGMNVTDIVRATYKEKKDPVKISEKLQEATNLLASAGQYEIQVSGYVNHIAETENKIKELEERIRIMKANVEATKLQRDSAKALAKVDRDKLGQINTDQLNAELKSVNEFNEKVDLVIQYEATKKDFDTKSKEAAEADISITDRRTKIETIIKEKGKLPVDGLEYNDDGLILNGTQFLPGEVSSSQEIEVAARLIIAANPKTKIFKMMNGESLGKKKFEAIIDFAQKNGYQGFIEIVKPGQESLIIEEIVEQE